MSQAMRIGFISSHLPKKCGIATFSRDLVAGIVRNHSKTEIYFVATESAHENYSYEKSVVAVIKTNSRQSYIDAAKILNRLNLDIVIIQHEYGLYGGRWITFTTETGKHRYPIGNYIIDLAERIDAPIITTLHTVLSKPFKQQVQVIKRLQSASRALIAMTPGARNTLTTVYGLSRPNIYVIPHGVPSIAKEKRQSALKHVGLDQSRAYLVTSGLINPNKGIDLVINALPKIIKQHPEVVLLIIGQTHPEVLKTAGETYREQLVAQAKKLGVYQHIKFINRYLSTEELTNFLKIADVYLTPHRDPQQATSGTLSYAIGAGLTIISTPYPHAKEILANGRGFLVPFNSSDKIAKVVNDVLENERLREKTKRLTRRLARGLTWPIIGKSYLKLIENLAAEKTYTS